MRDRMREARPRFAMGLATGLALLHLTALPAPALEAPPPMIVLHQSVSGGLSVSTDNCPEALKVLTGGLLLRSNITHVTTDSRSLAAAALTERAIPVALVGLIYTLEGPRNEVAILACAPESIKR